MPLVLARIDDRLIHGQVTVGWSRKLQPDRIILCDDEIAADPWQKRIYASSVPPQMSVSILDKAETVRHLNGGEEEDVQEEDVILLVGSPSDMRELHRLGLALDTVNLGGLHHAKGKVELLEYVYLDRSDLHALRDLLTAGVRLVAQTVPGAREIELDEDMLGSLEGAS